MNSKIKQLLTLFLIFVIFTGCGYSPPESTIIIKDVSRKPDSYTFSVAMLYTKIQNPYGILNTFPNGGIAKVLEQSAIFYVCDFETKQISYIKELKAPTDMRVSFDVSLGKWEKDNFYFIISGCPGDDGEECYGDLRKVDYFIMELNGNSSQTNIERDKINKSGESLAPMPGENVYMRLLAYTDLIKVLTESGGEYKDFVEVDQKIKGLKLK